MPISSRRVIAALGLCLLLAAPAAAQPNTAPLPPPAATATAPTVPSPNHLRVLIRGSIMALTQAVQTGNFTVLRDLATPSFQHFNTASQLGAVFGQMSEAKLDLSPVLLIEPQLLQAAQITPEGQMRLTGVFLTRPQQINFDLMFQQIEDRWRLNGISVTTSPAPADQVSKIQAPDAGKPAPQTADGGPAASPANPAPPVKAAAPAQPVKPKNVTAAIVPSPVKPRERRLEVPTNNTLPPPAAAPARKRETRETSRSSDPFNALSAPQ